MTSQSTDVLWATMTHLYRTTPLGVMVVGAFGHGGEARRLVHRLKYHADLGAGRTLAAAMARCIDADWACLVPVPRATTRRLRYGIDPARWLAGEVSLMSGLPVVDALRAGLWWPRHAGAQVRRPPVLSPRRPVGPMAVLVDDVATTGATLDRAAGLAGTPRALVATMAIGPKGP